MHHHHLLPLLLTLATAAPTTPKLTTAHGFRLIANITSTADLTPSVHLLPFELAHIGPAQNRAILRYQSPSSPIPTPSTGGTAVGPIFYQNGTASSQMNTSILTDAGTPPFPEGLAFLPDTNNTQSGGLYAFGGSGTQGIHLGGPFSELTLPDREEGTFVACNATIPYYGPTWSFVVVNWVGTNEKAQLEEGCVPITLLPECAALTELPEGAISSHEWAEEIHCYENVGKVVW